MNVYVIPFVHSGEEIFYDPQSHMDERIKPFIALREAIEEAGYGFKVTKDARYLDDPAAILSLNNVSAPVLDHIRSYPKEICSLLATEPPILHPWLYDRRLTETFNTVFVLFDDYVDGRNYVKFHHHQGRERPISQVPSFDEKRFLIMIQSNLVSDGPKELYSKRAEAASFFARVPDFDLYGSGWEGNPAWKGHYGGDKLHLLKNYRFHLCYENMEGQRGYVTERIFESLFSRTVPIYWGASNIDEYVPRECYIDRRNFSSNQELNAVLQSIDAKTYARYLAAGDKFLKSPEAERFSPKGFAKTILKRILP